MYIDKKILAVIALAISAFFLTWANMGSQSAKADTVIADRGYQLITARAVNGGDNLYIYDGNSGILAVFVYDPNSQGMRARAFISVGNLFSPNR